MTRLCLLVILILPLNSCRSELQKMERVIQTSWIVENVERLDSNETIQLGLNLFLIDENHTCRLPALVGEKRSIASWKLNKKGDDYYLKISGCGTTIFNGNFKLEYDRLDGLNKMILTSSKLRIVSQSLQ